MKQSDLFDNAPEKYPDAAGHRHVDTSVEAAQKVDAARGRKNEAYRAIINYLSCFGGATGSELADALGYDLLYIRPRLTELQLSEKIRYGGARRKNEKGSNERVFVVVGA